MENVILFFDRFKQLYVKSLTSYQEDKPVDGEFPNPVKATILGSKDGLKGFRIKNAVQLFGKWYDSGIWYDEKYQMWIGNNINMYFENLETIEVRDGLTRYLNKDDINKNDMEFHNLVDKVMERQVPEEIAAATDLLMRFGDARFKRMEEEENIWKKKSMPKIILPYYRRAVEIGSKIFDMTQVRKRIEILEVSST